MDDAQARKKALYRAKLNANKLEMRIESPLVRYNEFDQPLCRVCDVILESELLWSAHQASRKHHEAVKNVNANTGGLTRVNNVNAESLVELPKPKPEPTELHDSNPEAFTELPKAGSSSVVPPGFFDNNKTKRQKTGASAQTQVVEPFNSESEIDALSSAKVVDRETNEIQPDREHTQIPKIIVGTETQQAKGALPECFFDDKDADLRARGITPVKLNVNDRFSCLHGVC